MNEPSEARTSAAADATRPEGEEASSVGTGVVISEDGLILTNLHVVAEAKRLEITFADGMQAEASLVLAYPDKDLAMLKPNKIISRNKKWIKRDK